MSGDLHRLMHARRELGIQRYGQALAVDNRREPLADAVEEALDRLAYLMQELARVRAWVPSDPADIWASILDGGLDWIRAQEHDTEIWGAYALLDALIKRATRCGIVVAPQPPPRRL